MKANLQELLPQATWHDVEADDWALATTLDIWGIPAIVTQAEDGSVLKSHVGYLNKAKIREWT